MELYTLKQLIILTYRRYRDMRTHCLGIERRSARIQCKIYSREFLVRRLTYLRLKCDNTRNPSRCKASYTRKINNHLRIIEKYKERLREME